MRTIEDDVLDLRAQGLTVSQIAKRLGLTVLDVCEVIYEQNNKDKASTRLQ